MSATAVLTPPASGPYRYLDYFQERDRATFAGREEDIAEVSARMSADEPFVLYARSGLGKTSLLLAGVFPILRDRRLFPVHIRIIDNPVLDLRNALATALDRPCGVEAIDLDRLLASASVIGSVVLVFDQFEEFFINLRHKPAARRDFIHLIATLILRSHGDVRVTFSLREDYLAELDEFREAFPQILSNQYRLQPLSAFGARQAIVAPLVAAGIEFDQRLVVRLVDMLAEVSFDPVLLQIACGEVYREAIKRNAGASLTEEDLDKVGGIQGLFERYLDNAIARVPKNQLLLCRAMLDALTTSEETKRAVTFDALLHNDDFQASPDEIESVLDCLKQQKLIRPDLRGEKLFYELSHDRLAPSVVKWFKQDADFSRFRDARDLVAETTRRASLPDRLEALITAAQINKLIGPYRQRLRLSPEQREVMFWSAVYSRVEDVKFWADLYGMEQCCGALQRLLALESVDARLGAAAAAEQLASEMPELRAPCLKAALDDPDRNVRGAAARALARLAGPDEIAALKTALGSKRTRSRALDVLAAFVNGGPLQSFGRVSQWRARARARRRAIAQHREAIAQRAKRGMLVAPLAAAGWTATIGALLIALQSWVEGEVRWVMYAFFQAAVFGAIATAVALPIGWLVGRLAATRAAATGIEGKWMAVSWRLTLVAAAATVPIVFLSPYLLLLGGYWVLGLFAIVFVSGIIVRLFRSAIWPPDTMSLPARVAWAMLLGLLAAVAFNVTSILTESAEWVTFGTMFAIGPTVVALALTESATAFPIGRFPPVSTRLRIAVRAMLVLMALAIPGLFVWSVGRDSVPFLAARYIVANDTRIPISLATGRPDSLYFALESQDGQPHWLTAEFPDTKISAATGVVWSGSSSYGEPRGQLVYLPPGRHRLSAASSSGAAADLSLRLKTIPLLDDKSVLQLDEDSWSLETIRFDEVLSETKAELRVWKADVRASVKGRSDGSVRVLLPGGGSGDGDLSQLLPGQSTAKETKVKHSVPAPFTKLDFQTSTKTAETNHPELQPVLLESDGSFRLTLTYRLPVDASLPPPIGPSQPLYLPALFSVRGPDHVERLISSLPTGELIPRLEADQFLWRDDDELESAARRLSRLKRYDESIALWARVTVLRPDDFNAFNGLAWERLTAKRGREALEPARKAAELSKRMDVNILDTLAHAEYEAGNRNEARQAWEDVLQLDPSYYSPPSDDYCRKDIEILNSLRPPKQAPAPSKRY
jgi:hypothetical protein